MIKYLLLPLILLLGSGRIAFAQPANDLCTSPQVISIPSSGNICVTSTNVGATSDNTTTTCDVAPAGNEVWFTYITTGSQNTITVSPTGSPSAQQLVVNVQETNCSSGAITTCAASSTNGGNASVTWTFPLGIPVLISVETNGADGGFQLCITSTTPPPSPGSSCATASKLCDKNTFNVATMPANSNPARPSCFISSPQRPVYYQFTVGQSGTCEFTATPNGMIELDFALIDITTGCTGTMVACNYHFANAAGIATGIGPASCATCPINSIGGPTCRELCPTVNVTAGRTYLILIDNYSNNSTGFNFVWGGTFQMAPTAAFTALPNSGCGSVTASFTNNSVAATSYLWNFGNGTTSTAANPPPVTYSTPGTYLVSLTATSASGCVNVTSQSVVVTATPTVTVNPVTICDGQPATLTATPSQPGGTYAWSTGAATQTLNVSPSITTTYTVTYTLNGCASNPVTGTVTVNPSPATLASSNSPICEGTPLNLSASNIPGAGTYAWSGPNGFTSTLQNPTIANPTVAASGVYSVTPTLGSCAGTPSTVNVVINAAPQVTASSNSPICAGFSLNLNSTAAAGATYAWTGPNGFTSSLQNPIITNATSAASGTYTLAATASGCTGSSSTVNVVVNSSPAVTASSNSPVCQGGTLNLSATTVAGATYAWTGPAGYTSALQNPVITPVMPTAAGNYSVVASANGCQSQPSQTTVVVNPIPTATASSNSPVCEGSDINLTATTVAGATYGWTGPGGFMALVQNPVIPAATPANAGNYSMAIIVNGCPSMPSTINVVVNSTPSTIITSNSPLCTGDNLQLNSTTIAGGTYTWTGPNGFSSSIQNPTIPSALPNATGTYSLTVSQNGCTANPVTHNVLVNDFLDATITPAGPFCQSDAPVTLVGADPGGNWAGNGITNSFSGQFSPSVAGAGTHTITYTLGGSCGDVQTTNIVVDPIVDATIVQPGQFCFSDAAVNFTAAQSGGIWSGNGITDPTNGTFDPNTAGAGTHSITYTISGLCNDTDTKSVIVTPIVSAVINAAGPFCTDGTPVQLTAATSGGVWSGTGITNANTGTFDPAIAGQGTHAITYTTSPCGETRNANLTVYPKPNVSFTADATSGCEPLRVNFTNTSTPIGTTCNWTASDGFNFSGCNTATHTFTRPGCYDVTLMTSENGCSSSATVSNMICAFKNPTALFAYSPLSPVITSPQVFFQNRSTTDAVLFSWDFAGLGTATGANPNFIFPGVDGGVFNVCLEAMTSNGCVDTVCADVTITDELTFYIPNTFSPDEDGMNDIFGPVALGVMDLSYYFYIYNRWGELVFHSRSPENGWDGTHRGTPAMQGVYSWHLKLRDVSSEAHHVRRGHVLLMR